MNIYILMLIAFLSGYFTGLAVIRFINQKRTEAEQVKWLKIHQAAIEKWNASHRP